MSATPALLIRIQLNQIPSGIGRVLALAFLAGAVVTSLRPIQTLLSTGVLGEGDEIRLIVAMVLFFVGLGLFIGARQRASDRQTSATIESHAAPWTLSSTWQGGTTLTHKTRIDGGLAVLAGAFFLGGGALAAFVINLEVIGASEPNWPVLLVLLFPAAGLFLLAGVRTQLRKQRTFGTSELELGQIPSWRGRWITGVLRANIPRRDVPDHGFRVQLSCYRRTARRESSGSDGKSRVREDLRLLGREERHMRMRADRGDHIEIPVSFEIPADLPPSSPVRRPIRQLYRLRESEIHWHIEVHGDLPALDYESRFQVPVFDPEEFPDAAATSGAEAGAGADPWAEYEFVPEVSAPPSRHIPLERLAPDRLRLHVEPDRRSASVYVALFVGVGLFVGSWFFFPASIMGGLIFLGFGLLLFYGAWTLWSYETIIEVERDDVTIRSGSGGRKLQRVRASDIGEIDVTVEGTPDQSQYQIVILRAEGEGDQTGEPGQIAEGLASLMGGDSADAIQEAMKQSRRQLVSIPRLKDRQEAEWMADQLRKAVQASPSRHS